MFSRILIKCCVIVGGLGVGMCLVAVLRFLAFISDDTTQAFAELVTLGGFGFWLVFMAASFGTIAEIKQVLDERLK